MCGSAVERWLVVYCQIENLRDHRDAIPQLAQWTYEHWQRLTPQNNPPLEDRIKRLEARAHVDQIPSAFVALMDDAVVGMASLVAHDMDIHQDLSPWLASVFVAPDYRGRGIGSALSEHASGEAARLGYLTLYLVTFDQDAFYERLGWTVLEHVEYHGYPATIMTRDLTRTPPTRSREAG